MRLTSLLLGIFLALSSFSVELETPEVHFLTTQDGKAFRWRDEVVIYLSETQSVNLRFSRRGVTMSKVKKLAKKTRANTDFEIYRKYLCEAAYMWSAVGPKVRVTDNPSEANVMIYVGNSGNLHGAAYFTVWEDNIITGAVIVLSPHLSKMADEVKRWVMIHEIGHVLGLDHVPAGTSSIMVDTFKPEYGLTFYDIYAIRRLYE